MTGDQARALEPLISRPGPRRAALSRRRHHRLDPTDHRLRGAGRPKRRRGAARRARCTRSSATVTGSSPSRPATGGSRPGRVVNAAGVEADTISRLAGGEQFRTWPRQGQYWLLDRELGGRFRKVVGGVPTPVTRGIYCVPTTNRSLLLGPTAVDHEDRADRAVDSETLDHVFDAAQRLVPSIAPRACDQDVRRPTARPPTPPTGSPSTPRSRTWCTRPASARPGCRPHRPSRRWCAGCWKGLGLPVGEQRPDAVTELEPLPRLLGHAEPRAAVRPRPALRPGGLRLRAGDGGRDRGRARDGGASHLARGRPQAHPGDRRPLPGRALPGRRVVPALAAQRASARSRSPSRNRDATLGVGGDDA